MHAFPNAKLDLNKTIPVQLADLDTLMIDTKWSYAIGSKTANTTNSTRLAAAGLNANVCVDMFLSSQEANSSSTTTSSYEVMVWVGRWGPATQPIGNLLGSKDNFNINGTRL